MKRYEVYIQKLAKMFKISEATAKSIYEAINKYDVDVFCSYMADYDHPEERTEALEVLNKFKGLYSTEFQKTINAIQEYMDKDKEDYNIHEMRKEYVPAQTEEQL